MGFFRNGECEVNMKIVLLPLDERPCNFEFPVKLFDSEECGIVRPDRLGDKKIPADMDEIREFLVSQCREADAAVISMDTLLYGGLIPSRLHKYNADQIQERLELLRHIKRENPDLRILAFQCIMRCPSYSSNDEEPDYYEICGAEIHELGKILHKEKLAVGDPGDKQQLLEKIPADALKDYTERRQFNLRFNIETLKLAEEGVIEFLVIPQDDSASYGYTAMDQAAVRKEIRNRELDDRVYIYPGADEVGLTLLARICNQLHGKSPSVYLKYASIHAPYIVPRYEDRALGETVKYHLMAAGCIQAKSSAKADFVLALSAGAFEMPEADCQSDCAESFERDRNLTELVGAIEGYLHIGKPVSICDNAYANGSDLELIRAMNRRNLLFRVAGYAGWNTSSNSLGTAIAQGVRYLYYGDTDKHREFLLLRYLEDAGYCALIRRKITDNELPSMGLNYFDVKSSTGEISLLVKKELEGFAEKYLSSVFGQIEIKDVRMPWRRMFEADINVSYTESSM